LAADTRLSHVDAEGRPRMVDVGDKPWTRRTARARCQVRFPMAVWMALQQSGWQAAKGSVLHTAIIAGVQAGKKTSELIPFCHPLLIDRLDVRVQEGEAPLLVIETDAACHGPTGVEMEALTAAMGAALAVYDMCKALSHDLRIEDLRLLEKTGGKSDWTAAP
jgi:cyclic pyranopterin monophosphate synthase